jgi:hypothetical protein
VRIRLTLDVERRRPEPGGEPQFEHRDTDALVESQPGWPETHRLGFVPAPTYPEERAR